MKYRTEVTINAPLERVASLFEDPGNYAKWQPDLISSERVSGEPGTVGAVTKMVFRMGKRQLQLTETVDERTPPTDYTFRYDAKGVKNRTRNTFGRDGEGTRWVVVNEFKFSGFMWIIGKLFGRAFRKQTLKEMNLFKAFVEGQES